METVSDQSLVHKRKYQRCRTIRDILLEHSIDIDQSTCNVDLLSGPLSEGVEVEDERYLNTQLMRAHVVNTELEAGIVNKALVQLNILINNAPHVRSVQQGQYVYPLVLETTRRGRKFPVLTMNGEGFELITRVVWLTLREKLYIVMMILLDRRRLVAQLDFSQPISWSYEITQKYPVVFDSVRDLVDLHMLRANKPPPSVSSTAVAFMCILFARDAFSTAGVPHSRLFSCVWSFMHMYVMDRMDPRVLPVETNSMDTSESDTMCVQRPEQWIAPFSSLVREKGLHQEVFNKFVGFLCNSNGTTISEHLAICMKYAVAIPDLQDWIFKPAAASNVHVHPYTPHSFRLIRGVAMLNMFQEIGPLHTLQYMYDKTKYITKQVNEYGALIIDKSTSTETSYDRTFYEAIKSISVVDFDTNKNGTQWVIVGKLDDLHMLQQVMYSQFIISNAPNIQQIASVTPMAFVLCGQLAIPDKNRSDKDIHSVAPVLRMLSNMMTTACTTPDVQRSTYYTDQYANTDTIEIVTTLLHKVEAYEQCTSRSPVGSSFMPVFTAEMDNVRLFPDRITITENSPYIVIKEMDDSQIAPMSSATSTFYTQNMTNIYQSILLISLPHIIHEDTVRTLLGIYDFTCDDGRAKFTLGAAVHMRLSAYPWVRAVLDNHINHDKLIDTSFNKDVFPLLKPLLKSKMKQNTTAEEKTASRNEIKGVVDSVRSIYSHATKKERTQMKVGIINKCGHNNPHNLSLLSDGSTDTRKYEQTEGSWIQLTPRDTIIMFKIIMHVVDMLTESVPNKIKAKTTLYYFLCGLVVDARNIHGSILSSLSPEWLPTSHRASDYFFRRNTSRLLYNTKVNTVTDPNKALMHTWVYVLLKAFYSLDIDPSMVDEIVDYLVDPCVCVSYGRYKMDDTQWTTDSYLFKPAVVDNGYALTPLSISILLATNMHKSIVDLANSNTRNLVINAFCDTPATNGRNNTPKHQRQNSANTAVSSLVFSPPPRSTSQQTFNYTLPTPTQDFSSQPRSITTPNVQHFTYRQ